MTTLPQVLTSARARIEDEKNWTTGAYARTRGHNVIGPECKNARCFCAVGALRAVTTRFEELRAASDALNAASYATFSTSIFNANDRLGHSAVLQIYDKAIETASHTEGGKG